MYWTLELAYHLEDAPWPANKEELIETMLSAQERHWKWWKIWKNLMRMRSMNA